MPQNGVILLNDHNGSVAAILLQTRRLAPYGHKLPFNQMLEDYQRLFA